MTILDLVLGDVCYAVYSTHKHTPEKPRLRVVIPLDRAVQPDAYQAIARRIADDIGMDLFDDTTYEAERLMYWPSTSTDGEYIFSLTIARTVWIRTMCLLHTMTGVILRRGQRVLGQIRCGRQL